ncbi:major facilitator superfamily domain-containing protein [Rhodocollybia butyracea]|uniref:Major facilitator superfamily domain-containing protein n=1 Tax=Rhodocollybia butyracea TaxID=206335 RepID=A0A9P5P7B5_9AGAR|nr:major facilitator superfamily domain-containing protein [Rhodocollybia butyracea]
MANDIDHDLGTRPPATPLPKFQLAIVWLIRLSDPVLYTQIFPYINEYILFLHLTHEPSQAGFYSGLLDSTFAITQFLATYHWSMLSNRFGRKPVALIGTFGVALSTVYLGLSTSLTHLLILRAIGGIFGGTASVVQSMVGDLSDASNQATVFPIYALAWPIGSITGPIIGGMLSNPADTYGSFFQNSIFSRHPYFLPGLVSGVLALLCVLFAYFYLEEVSSFVQRRPSLMCKSAIISLSELSPLNELSSDAPQPEFTLIETFSIPIIRVLAISVFSLNMNGVAFDFLFVLFCYTPIENGGLSFSPLTIGYVLSSAGIIYSFLQIVIMPVVLKRVEAAKLYFIAVASWPVVFATLPFLNVIASHGLVAETGDMTPFSTFILWIGVGLVLTASKVGSVAYILSLILTKTNSSNPALLAVSNGIISCAMSLARIISPVLSSFIFSISIEYHLLRGYFWALVMVCSCFLTCILTQNVVRLSQSSLNVD